MENFRLDTKKNTCPFSNMPQTVQCLRSFCKLQPCSLLLFFILKSSTLAQCSFLLNTKFTVFAANEGSLGSNLFCANNPQKPCTMHIQLKWNTILFSSQKVWGKRNYFLRTIPCCITNPKPCTINVKFVKLQRSCFCSLLEIYYASWLIFKQLVSQQS